MLRVMPNLPGLMLLKRPLRLTLSGAPLVGVVHRGKFILDELARMRPGRIGVRVVGGPHDFVSAVLVGGEADVRGFELEGRPDLALHVLARFERQAGAFEMAQAIVSM